MNICILAPIENIDKVREAATAVFNVPVLKIALSPNGKQPTTHYFCVANVSQELYDKMLDLRQYSDMTTENPKDFLKRKRLKVVRQNI